MSSGGTQVLSNEGLKQTQDAATRLGWEPSDSVNANVQIKFGWMDRLRILLGRMVVVHTCVLTEKQTGLTSRDETFVHVRRVFASKIVGYEVTPDPTNSAH